MKTGYEKLIESIDFKEYNKWYRKFKWKGQTKEDLYKMFTGIRLLSQHNKAKYPGEYLPPEPKEAIEYYRNLCKD